MKRPVCSLFLGLSVFSAAAAAKTQVTLLLSHERARSGDAIMAGVRLRMPAGWHTYWRNSGDSGAATTIKWNLPPGISAGEIEWPVPVTHTTGDLVTYDYDNEVVLIVPLTLGVNAASGIAKVGAKVSWLECDVATCVPGKADLEATFTVGNVLKPSANAAVIESWQKKLPQKDSGLNFTAAWNGAADGDHRKLLLAWTASDGAKEGSFYPYETADYAVKPMASVTTAESGKIRQNRIVEKLEGNWPSEVAGIVVHRGGSGSVAHAVKAAIAGKGMLAAAAGTESKEVGTSKANAENAAQAIAQPKSLAFYLGLAFLGGLILNIMPCVLPVIALKILGFVNQSAESPGTVRKLGVIYGLGVLFSFLVLAGLVIAVQQAGRAASWGMQFQDPRFLVAITILITLVALNLFGLFEVTLGGAAMDTAGQLASKGGAAGAFFNGVLATALATPCTAPFLAVGLGFAFSQPPAVIAVMFLTVGLGLAMPYVVLSFAPALLGFLPKPGAWMEKFKVAMGFPMLATALWLFTLTRSHFDKSSTLWFGFFLIVLAMGAWIWGEFVQRGTKRRALAMIVTLLLVGGFGAYALTRSPDAIEWQPWSAAAVEKARSESRAVFVDFTADWCVTCQANKKTSIEIPSVRAKLKEINAVALLGDYTREDPAITDELAKFGRAGVPLVLVFPRDATKPPIVLPEILTPGIVLNALEKAAK